MANKKVNILVKLRNVRLSFPVLYVPEPNDKGKLLYGAAFLMANGSPNIKLIEDAIKEQCKQQNGGNPLPYGRTCLRNGEDKEFAGYGPTIKFTSTNSPNKPLVVDTAGNDIPQNAANAPYAGCYVNANIDVWWQGDDSGFGKRVNASLRSVQFLRHGEPFGAGPKDAKEEFGDVPEDAGDAPAGGDDDLN